VYLFIFAGICIGIAIILKVQKEINKVNKIKKDLYILIHEFEGLKLKVIVNSMLLNKWIKIWERYHDGTGRKMDK